MVFFSLQILLHAHIPSSLSFSSTFKLPTLCETCAPRSIASFHFLQLHLHNFTKTRCSHTLSYQPPTSPDYKQDISALHAAS